jgi:phosphoribosyl 1,2-cyclic phosphate phosphodiesterase
MQHGSTPTTGWRIGPFAYLTDAHHIPDASVDLLDGVEVIVLDALRARSHPTHFSFDEAVEMARRIGARETYFIHMTHDVLHDEQEACLPNDVHLGYDGLQIEVDCAPVQTPARMSPDAQPDA